MRLLIYSNPPNAFFRPLGTYTAVPTIDEMKDIFMKIMVEVNDKVKRAYRRQGNKGPCATDGNPYGDS
jgi:hypothetical protein